MSRSPLSENTIQQLVDSVFFIDSELLNQVHSSSSSQVSESEVDDSDADPNYDPNSTNPSFLSSQTVNRSVLSSSEEDDPHPPTCTRPTAHQPRQRGRPRRTHASSGSESEHESDGWEGVLEGRDPGLNHTFEFNETPGCKNCIPRNSPPLTYFDIFSHCPF